MLATRTKLFHAIVSLGLAAVPAACSPSIAHETAAGSAGGTGGAGGSAQAATTGQSSTSHGSAATGTTATSSASGSGGAGGMGQPDSGAPDASTMDAHWDAVAIK